MATLQEQSDAAFRDPDPLDVHEQVAAEAAAADSDGYPVPQYADEEGESFPPQLELPEGESLQTPTTNLEFADDETNTGPDLGTEESGETVRQEQTRSDDIHADSRRPTEAASQSEATKDGLSDSLIDRAVEYGMHPAEARATFTDDSALAQHLLKRDQDMLAAAAAMRQQTQQPLQQPVPQQQPMQQPQQQQVQPRTPEQQQQQAAQQAIEAWKIKNPESWDKDLVAEFEGMSQQTTQLIAQQQQELQELRQLVQHTHQFQQQQIQRQQQEAAQREFTEFDQSIANLGDEWSDALGKGSGHELNPNGAEIFNRGRVLKTYKQLEQLHQQQGRKVSRNALLQNSLLISFPERQASAAASQGQQQPQAAHGQYTRRPTGKSQSGGKKDPREALLQRWDREWGGTGGDEEYDVL